MLINSLEVSRGRKLSLRLGFVDTRPVGLFMWVMDAGPEGVLLYLLEAN